MPISNSHLTQPLTRGSNRRGKSGALAWKQGGMWENVNAFPTTEGRKYSQYTSEWGCVIMRKSNGHSFQRTYSEFHSIIIVRWNEWLIGIYSAMILSSRFPTYRLVFMLRLLIMCYVCLSLVIDEKKLHIDLKWLEVRSKVILWKKIPKIILKWFSVILDVSNSVIAKVECIAFKHFGDIPSVHL